MGGHQRGAEKKAAAWPAASAAVAASGSALAQSGEVNVYTYRESKLIQPLFDAFTKDTGIKVNVISASSGLEQRINDGLPYIAKHDDGHV